MATSATKSKKSVADKCGNWPPSRGPQPRWMRRKTTYALPTLGRGQPPKRMPNAPALVRRELKKADEGSLARIKVMVRGKNGKFKTVPYKRSPPFRRHGSWNVSIQVAALSEITLEQAEDLLDSTPAGTTPRAFTFFTGDRTFRTLIDYPVKKPVDLTIPPYRRDYPMSNAGVGRRKHTSLSYVLWTVAQEYRRIYRAHKKHGVYGHAIGDLVFEQVHLLGREPDGAWRLSLSIGS